MAEIGEMEDAIRPVDLVVDEEALGLLPGSNVIRFDRRRTRIMRPLPEPARQDPDPGARAHSSNAVDSAKEIYTLAVAGAVLLAEIASRMGPSTFAEDANKAVPLVQESVELAIDDAFKSIAQGCRDRGHQSSESAKAGLVELLAFEHFTDVPNYRLTIRLVRLLSSASKADDGR
jgi:hypothetical protein